MNTRFKDIFRGKVVNKRLTVNTGVDEFPRFVVEYLIDNYCTEESFQDDLQQVVRRLRENFVHGAEAEKIRHQIRETRNHSIIANLEVRLQETEDKYWGTISAVNEQFVNVSESLVRQYPMLLSGGMWGTITLTNNATGKVGVVGSRDAVVFDEIANTDFTDPKALVSIMQGYMQDGKFSRGKKEILAFASIVLVGNIDIQAKLPHEKYYHLFEPLPDFLQVEAFIDRLHAYVPGWEIPKINPTSLPQDYAFITDS